MYGQFALPSLRFYFHYLFAVSNKYLIIPEHLMPDISIIPVTLIFPVPFCGYCHSLPKALNTDNNALTI